MDQKQILCAARLAVEKIVEDLSDRGGLRQEFERIDPDVRAELEATWRAKAVRAIEEALETLA